MAIITTTVRKDLTSTHTIRIFSASLSHTLILREEKKLIFEHARSIILNLISWPWGVQKSNFFLYLAFPNIGVCVGEKFPYAVVKEATLHINVYLQMSSLLQTLGQRPSQHILAVEHSPGGLHNRIQQTVTGTSVPQRIQSRTWLNIKTILRLSIWLSYLNVMKKTITTKISVRSL